MKLVDCIVAEIGFEDQALAQELADWMNLDQQEPAFKAHRSQLARLCRSIEGARKVLGLDDLASALGGESQDDVLRALQERRARLQTLHVLWNFFRSKLLQRLEPKGEHFAHQEFLLAADDLAWACYRPFLERLQGQQQGLREPPLTYLSLEPAPFAQARRSAFVPPGLDPQKRDLLYSILRKLPVPVIGVPWLHVGHLPDLCLVGHETAHVVADDLGLHKSFDSLVADVAEIPAERKAHWVSWLDESFADIFGVLACGAGYGFALMRALADHVGVIHQETVQPTGAYPPRHVRMHLTRVTAEHLDVPVDFAEHWQLAYRPPFTDHSRDVEPLVAHLLAYGFERLGGARVAEILPPPKTSTVRAYVDALLEQEPFPVSGDIRCAIAAAAVAHAAGDQPWTSTSQPYQRLSQHIIAQRDDGYRDDGVSLVRARVMAAGDSRVDSARMQQEDDTIGRDIASLLGVADN